MKTTTRSDRNQITLLIVDDRPVVRKELTHLFELTGKFKVAGEAGDGRQAVEETVRLQPDAVIMDLEMPGMDGFEATKQIKLLEKAPAVIILTVYGDPEHQIRAKESGADAFLVKGLDFTAMQDVIQHACRKPDERKVPKSNP